MNRLLCLLFISQIMGGTAYSSEGKDSRSGIISGRVVEKNTGYTLSGVQVKTLGFDLTTVSNENGRFEIHSVPVGLHTLICELDGFQSTILTDISVRPSRNTQVVVRLELNAVSESVQVSASYYERSDTGASGMVNLTSEEVRRAPGTGGGISRLLSTMPGVSTTEDSATDLIVRGGNPIENGFYIDNIEVFNINHLPTQGSTGGAFSVIHQEIIDRVDFFAGGFSPEFGGHLSSITDISFREGNRKELDVQLDVSAVGAGIVVEGPIRRNESSWIFTARKSYLEVMKDAGLSEFDALPATFDSQLKVSHSLTSRHRVGLLNTFGSGSFREEQDEMAELPIRFHTQRYTSNTAGITLDSVWSRSLASNTSLSYSLLRSDEGDMQDNDGSWLDHEKQDASWIAVRNKNYWHPGRRFKVRFGGDAKFLREDNRLFAQDELNDDPNQLVIQTHTRSYHDHRYSGFASMVVSPFSSLDLVLGGRATRSSAHDMWSLDPRFSVIWRATGRMILRGAYAEVHQAWPSRVLLTTAASAKSFRDMWVRGSSIGMDFYLGQGYRLSLEAYDKDYRHLPVSSSLPHHLVLDVAIENELLPEELSDIGEGKSRGFEVVLQKKMTGRLYGMASYAYSESRYTALDGRWYDRRFSNPHVSHLMVGWRPSKTWTLSMKWSLMSGRPDTPLDQAMTQQLGYPVYDLSRFHTARFPAYNRLDIRMDKRFYFGSSNLALYMDVWNVLNHDNVAYYEWNEKNRVLSPGTHIGLLPVIGIEYEF